MALTAAQVRGRIKNLAVKSGADPRTLMRMYMMERFLERVAMSEYRDKFIIKGGVLVSSMVGISMRSTMDIDASIQNSELTLENATMIIKAISDIQLNDNIVFIVNSVEIIMDEMEYPGIRISLNALMEKMATPIKLDMSTGDIITPKAIEYTYPLLLEERKIHLWSYNLETILAEKFQSILVRERANTRMRDYYDIYILIHLYVQTIDRSIFKEAYTATCKNRGSILIIGQESSIIDNIENHPKLSELWAQYQKKYVYASEISFQQVIESLRKLASCIQS